jgi:hypothetical protein
MEAEGASDRQKVQTMNIEYGLELVAVIGEKERPVGVPRRLMQIVILLD